MNRNQYFSKWGAGLVVFSVLLIIFSVEIPVLTGVSSYASLNSEDAAVVIVGTYFVYSKIRYGWSLEITLPRVTFYLGLVSGWILLTLIIASFRSQQSVMASFLWVFKWFEVVVFFLLLQDLFDRHKSGLAVQSIVYGGIVIALYSLLTSILGGYRAEAFFNNPNVLSSFLVLSASLAAAYVVFTRKYTYFFAVLLISGGVVTTGSRSGILGLLVAFTVLSLITIRNWNTSDIFIILVTGISLMPTIPFIIDSSVIDRLTGWISFRDGRLVLADTRAARSFRVRAELVEKALDLFQQQPIFGYGWFAVPSRVGYLDVFYTILLVELGIIGTVLYMLFTVSIIRAWIVDYQKGALVVGSAGVAWYCGLLAQSIGGAFPRIPQIMFLTFIVLVASASTSLNSVE